MSMCRPFALTSATVPAVLYKVSSTGFPRVNTVRTRRRSRRAVAAWVGFADVGSTPGLEPEDVDFLRAVRPIVEFLGGTLSVAADVGALPIERNGRPIAYVRGSELHGALDRTIEAVERDVGAELSAMSREQKQVAVRTLDEQGVFLLRGAVDQVARSMGVSRVTLYSYLNALERRA